MKPSISKRIEETEQLLLRIPEAAKALGMCRTSVYNLIKEGTLPTVRVGRRSVRVPFAALRKWIEQNTTGK